VFSFRKQSLFQQLKQGITEGEAPTSIRLNPFKCKEGEDAAGEPIPWCPSTGRYLSTRPNFTFDPWLHAGKYYVQEASSIVRDSKTGDVIVKLVNLLPVSIETDVRLPGMDGIQSSATRTVLAGAPETTPLPVTDTIEAGTSFKQELPAYSFTVIRLKTQKGKNKQ
jgi:hypothetical protein